MANGLEILLGLLLKVKRGLKWGNQTKCYKVFLKRTLHIICVECINNNRLAEMSDLGIILKKFAKGVGACVSLNT